MLMECFRAHPGRPLPEYLLSRSRAGTDHVNLIAGAEGYTMGAIRGRFFPTRTTPEVRGRRRVSAFLARWLRAGAVGVATLNLQRSFEKNLPGRIPDAWHHQMILGVNEREGMVHLTNPLESIKESALEALLDSDSTLLVRSADIREFWEAGRGQLGDISKVLGRQDARWNQMNVLGQVVSVLREPPNSNFGGHASTHIVIPAAYKAGITLFAHANSQVWRDIESLSMTCLQSETEGSREYFHLMNLADDMKGGKSGLQNLNEICDFGEVSRVEFDMEGL